MGKKSKRNAKTEPEHTQTHSDTHTRTKHRRDGLEVGEPKVLGQDAALAGMGFPGGDKQAAAGNPFDVFHLQLGLGEVLDVGHQQVFDGGGVGDKKMVHQGCHYNKLHAFTTFMSFANWGFTVLQIHPLNFYKIHPLNFYKSELIHLLKFSNCSSMLLFIDF